MALKKLGRIVTADVVRDAIGLTGAAFVSYGAWLVYVPAGFIVGGALLTLGAWLHGRAASRAGAD